MSEVNPVKTLFYLGLPDDTVGQQGMSAVPVATLSCMFGCECTTPRLTSAFLSSRFTSSLNKKKVTAVSGCVKKVEVEFKDGVYSVISEDPLCRAYRLPSVCWDYFRYLRLLAILGDIKRD